MFDALIRFIRGQYRTNEFIPLHAPVFAGNERSYVLQAIGSTFVSIVRKLWMRPPLDPSSRLRDNNFDALRLIFASMVVVYHLGFLSQAGSLDWARVHVSATFAVQAFFVVSGFLVTMSFENSSSWWSYFNKRLRRIAPAYLFVVFAAAVSLSAISSLSLRAYFSDPGFTRYLLYNLVLENFKAPSLPGVFRDNFVNAVNGSLWTIKIEAGFYIAVPFMVLASRRYGYRAMLPILFAASLLWRVSLEEYPWPHDNDMYARLARQLPGQLSFFVGGAWAYYRLRDGCLPRFLPALIGTVIYALSDGIIFLLIAPAAVTAVVSWAALSGARLPATGKYGDYSYGIYLYHFPIIQTCIACGLFVAHSAAVATLEICALVLFSGVISWFVIERSFLRNRPASRK